MSKDSWLDRAYWKSTVFIIIVLSLYQAYVICFVITDLKTSEADYNNPSLLAMIILFCMCAFQGIVLMIYYWVIVFNFVPGIKCEEGKIIGEQGNFFFE